VNWNSNSYYKTIELRFNAKAAKMAKKKKSPENCKMTPERQTDNVITSYETVALQENFVDRPESYDLFSAKSCLFLAHSLGYISPFLYTICPKARYKKKFL
jgi:hypothetical protein